MKYVIEKLSDKSDIITVVNGFNTLDNAKNFMEWLKSVAINATSQSYEVYTYNLYSYNEDTEEIDYLDSFETNKIL